MQDYYYCVGDDVDCELRGPFCSASKSVKGVSQDIARSIVLEVEEEDWPIVLNVFNSDKKLMGTFYVNMEYTQSFYCTSRGKYEECREFGDVF